MKKDSQIIVSEKMFSSYSNEEQLLIKRIQAKDLIKQIEDIEDYDNLGEETHKQLMIYMFLFSNPSASFLNNDNIEYTVVGNEVIEKVYTVKKEEGIVEPTLPDYIFERTEYKREVLVEGSIGFVIDYKEYINSKTYYDYSEDSYERKNWRTLEYNWKNYVKEINR